MLFKKKKKKEEVVVEPNTPKSEVEDKGEEIGLVSETPIADETIPSNTESAILTNQDVTEEIDKTIEDFNEIHHESLAKDEEKIDFKKMSVDELIQDFNIDEYCTNCGSKVNLDADVCFVCGAEIEK